MVSIAITADTAPMGSLPWKTRQKRNLNDYESAAREIVEGFVGALNSEIRGNFQLSQAWLGIARGYFYGFPGTKRLDTFKVTWQPAKSPRRFFLRRTLFRGTVYATDHGIEIFYQHRKVPATYMHVGFSLGQEVNNTVSVMMSQARPALRQKVSRLSAEA